MIGRGDIFKDRSGWVAGLFCFAIYYSLIGGWPARCSYYTVSMGPASKQEKRFSR